MLRRSAVALALLPLLGCGVPISRSSSASYSDSTIESDITVGVWKSPLYAVDGAPTTGGAGEIRIRRIRETYDYIYDDDPLFVSRRRDVTLLVHGLPPFRTFAWEMEAPGIAPSPFATDGEGRARILLGEAEVLPPPGTRVLVRDGSGSGLLAGLVPDWERLRWHRARSRAVIEGLDGVDARVETFRHFGQGRERFTVLVRGLEDGASATLRIGGAPAGTAVADERGRALFAWDSCTARVLPGNVASVTALAGLPVEVVVGGVTVLAGELPPL